MILEATEHTMKHREPTHILDGEVETLKALLKLDAKLDTQLDSLKEQMGGLKKEVKEINENLQYFKVFSKILGSSAVVGICIKYVASLFS